MICNIQKQVHYKVHTQNRNHYHEIHSLVELLVFYLQDQIYRLLEGVHYHCSGIVRIVVGSTCMDSSLSQKRYPSDLVRSSDICSRVVTKHEETALSVPLSHYFSDILKCYFLGFTKVEFVQLKSMSLTVLLQHVVERSKGYSWPMVAPCPGDIILCCKVGREWQISILFFQENVMNDFQCFLVGTDIVECKNGTYLLPPFMKASWQTVSLQPLQYPRFDIIKVAIFQLELEQMM